MRPDIRAFHEEPFGPVAVVYSVSSDEEAVELANTVAYELGASVWGGESSGWPISSTSAWGT